MGSTFGQKLKEWREATGISQAELARRIDASPTWVSNLERDFSPTAKGGKPQPSVEMCDKIAHALGVRIAEVRLAAGYAPPSEGTSAEAGDTRAKEAARTAEMIENWMTMSPDEQARALAMIKLLRGERPVPHVKQDVFEVLDKMIQEMPVPTEPLPENPFKEDKKVDRR